MIQAIGDRTLAQRPSIACWLAGRAKWPAFLDKFFHPRRASTAEALRRGIRRGDIRADADIDLLLDMLASTTYYRVLFAHLPVTASLAEDVVKLVLAGVATEQWRTRSGNVNAI
ncbi:putative MPP superfamily phosphohydrolase [Streptomyces sp. W4I9-2]|nr:putative MPP superfamily phosphohydrolase [Streptomyces sp. W4I9-2]